MTSQRLTFDGDLELIDGYSEDGYTIQAMSGTRFGSPVTVETVIASFLRDGSIVSKTGDENREMQIPVRISGPDGIALALGEKRLNLATGKRTTLEWTPPDGISPPTAFDVLTSSLSRVEDGDWDVEEVHGSRTFLLRLVCLPFGRSAGKFVDVSTSPPGASDGTVFYSAQSATGWAEFGTRSKNGGPAPSFTVDNSIFVEGTGSIKALVCDWEQGFVYNIGNGTGGYYAANGGTSRHEVTGLSLDTDTGGYISVAVRFDPFYDASKLTQVFQSTSPGVWTEVTSFAAVSVDSDSFVHYRWPVDEGLSIIGFRFVATHGTKGQVSYLAAPYVWYDDFRLLATASTDQQIVKHLTVEGSARTTGSLHIGSGTESVPLGQVLVVTVPTDEVPLGFNPEGRPWVTQGYLVADATALGGSYYTPDADDFYVGQFSTPIVNVPVRLLTAGAYTMVALVKTSAGTVTSGVQAQLNVNGTLTGPVSQAEVSRASTTTDWQFVTLGTVYLPPLPVQGADPTTTVRLIFKGDHLANVYMIPAWQVDGHPVADYSIVDCGTGTASAGGPSSHLWLDSPSVDQPRGGLWRGPTDDRLNTRSAWPDAKRPGIHTFRPGDLSAFLISTAAFGPTLELEYYPAWWANAAL